ncbi:hypothetical protein RND81_02G231200 [Saponaria officinalis]|uniref:Uncharacterized protein n=1 Tax=Saponaria officinalis TaxID=3572 RepID=A0AAW1MST6_SAPOF
MGGHNNNGYNSPWDDEFCDNKIYDDQIYTLNKINYNENKSKKSLTKKLSRKFSDSFGKTKEASSNGVDKTKDSFSKGMKKVKLGAASSFSWAAQKFRKSFQK